MARATGWKRVKNAANGVEALALSTGDPAREPYFFGMGTADSGRLSSGSRAGAVVEFPDAYGFGEAWELRFRTADTSNGQFQGIYLQVRSDVANTSTIRGMEIEARQGGAVALGGLTAIQCQANIASSSTGNVTTAYGLSAEVQMDDTYTGTVTTLAGLRTKIQTEDGATVTNGYGVQIENEAVTGGLKLDAAVRVDYTNAGTGFDTIIDSTGTLTTASDTDKVLLWKFLRSDGTTVYMRYDTSDNALAFATS